MANVAIIGGGVNGFGCGIKIKEAFPNFNVGIFTKDITPNTTGDGSAGLWTPYILGKTPDEKINAWSEDTFKFFHKRWSQGEAGACLFPVITLNSQEDDTSPAWKHIPYGFTKLNDKQIKYYGQNSDRDFKYGSHYLAYSCEPRLLLPYLMQRFRDARGYVVMREVESLAEFAEEGFDIIINCTGLGARIVVPDDKMFPTRGQVARVNAPWMKEVVFADEYYIIPNFGNLVFGGTSQKNDFNTTIDPKDSKMIRDGCRKMVPHLEAAPILFEWAGLRPSHEDATRVERQDILTSGNKNVIVIHNYGHGGSGVTMFWGCATEVLNILTEAYKGKLLTSKL